MLVTRVLLQVLENTYRDTFWQTCKYWMMFCAQWHCNMLPYWNHVLLSCNNILTDCFLCPSCFLSHLFFFLVSEATGAVSMTFGEIFRDETIEQQLESLVGSLKAAKKRGILSFKGDLLLQGVHDNVLITLMQWISPGSTTPLFFNTHHHHLLG